MRGTNLIFGEFLDGNILLRRAIFRKFINLFVESKRTNKKYKLILKGNKFSQALLDKIGESNLWVIEKVQKVASFFKKIR
jgi:hypothetical protein